MTMDEQFQNAHKPEASDPRSREAWLQEDLEAAAVARYEVIFLADPPQPPILVPGLIPRSVFGMVGPGASNKSTFMLWLMVRLAIGKPVLGEPGENRKCLYVSAEDEAHILHYRVRALCDAMGLSEVQQQLVGANLILEDFTGQTRRLVEVDETGNLAQNPWVDALAATYGGRWVDLCVFDPAVYFGPGERFLNDSEAELMRAGRRLSRLLGTEDTPTAVGYIHHTARASRVKASLTSTLAAGGSAFADNARGVLVLHRHVKDHSGFPRPATIPEAAVESGRAFRVHIAKFSHGKQLVQPVWVVRGDANPWELRVVPPIEDVAAAKAHERVVHAYITKHQDSVALSQKAIEAGVSNQVPRARTRDALQRLAIGARIDLHAPIPEHLVTSRKKGPQTCIRTAANCPVADPVFGDEAEDYAV
jgi:hypothetical protein